MLSDNGSANCGLKQVRGGPTRLTFSNQGLITEELIITLSLVSIEILIDYTFEFFYCEPERYHLKTLQR